MSNHNSKIRHSNKVIYKDFLRDRKQFDSWIENYEVALGAYNYLEFDHDLDDYVMTLLNEALTSGLNYSTDQQRFFHASMVLAQILFKHRKYRLAENHLLLLRDLEFSSEKPDWISFYSVITYYKLELPYILDKPSGFFKELDRIDESTIEKYQKKITVIKDFLNTIIQHVSFTNSSSISETFIEKLEDWLSPYLKKVIYEYNNLMIRTDHTKIMVIQPEPYDTFSDLEMQVLLNEKERLEQRVSELENEISLLREKLFTIETETTLPVILSDLLSESDSFKKHKVLVYGATRIDDSIIYGLAKSIGFDKEQITIENEYSKQKIDFSKMQHGSRYSGILFGPVAHSLPGKGKYGSVIEMMINEEGYPHVIEIKTETGQLKITKSAMREALMKMKVHLQTLSLQ